MNDKQKGIEISAIMGIMKEQVIEKNKKLVAQNLHSEQEAFDGAKMFFDLAFMNDTDFNKISKMFLG